MGIKVLCQECKKEFECYPSGVNRITNNNYCSNACFNKHRERTRKAYKCKECGRHVNGYKKRKISFCSKGCGTAYRNKQNSKWNKIWSKEQLERMYYGDKMSMSEISKNYNTDVSNVFQWFRRYGIKKRPVSEVISIGIQRNIEKFREASRGCKNPMFGKISYPKARYVKNLGHSVRSIWEEEIAKILKENNIPYKYEGIKFVINGGNNTYTPDFIIGKIVIEVKGCLFEPNRKKLIKFKSEYPYMKLWIISARGHRFDFSFSDKLFKFFYSGRDKEGKQKYKIDNEEKERFLNEIRANIEG